MGRRRGKKKTPLPPPPPPSVSSMAVTKEEEEEEEEEEKDFGKKLVYASICKTDDSVNCWIMIDPNYNEDYDDYNIRLKSVPEMEFPAHLDLHEIHFYGCAVCESKVYFIGGVAGSGMHPDYYSKKVFTYDLASKKWEEEPSQLNVARAFHSVVVIDDKLIYVFGGITYRRDTMFISAEQWIECYNPKNRTWELLPTSSAPPPAVCKAEGFNFHAVYERVNQILFFFPVTGVYSFNYVTKTWKDCRHPYLNQCAKIFCAQVAVVGDVLFRHYFGTIVAFDLSKNQLLFSHSLGDFVNVSFGDPEICGYGTEPTFLVRVAKETLLLICFDNISENNTGLHCYKLQIHKSTSDSRFDFHLLPDGCGSFHTPGFVLEDCVVV